MNEMLQDDILGKEAYTINGDYLGKIIRVEGKPDAVIRSERLFAIIRVARFLFNPDLVQLSLEKFNFLEGQNVTFDITKQEFKNLQHLYRIERKRLLKAEKERTRVKEDFNKAATDTLGRYKF
ncbi:MAG TPA: PRC-barrel domain-containing protein [Candidatus Bathyarchaeia archaeon]|nr:PRC-barrel domain-containing protein [Candidatus Bathyarchaeia archaeon]